MNSNLERKVPVELLCLSLLESRDMYGYEMAQEIKKRSGGKLVVKLTTLYMALKRLEEKNHVSVYYMSTRDAKERSRLYYHAEASSAEYQKCLEEEYRTIMEGVQAFWEYSAEVNGHEG